MNDDSDKEKIAELCGTIIGDGWIQSNEQSFFIAGDSTEDKEYYDNYLAKIFEDVLIPVKPREFPYWQVYGIGIYQKKVIKKLLSWEIPKGKKAKTCQVPKWILNGEDKIIKAFIRGLFDADGCVFCQKAYGKYNSKFDKTHHSKIRLRITSISCQLIDQIFFLCTKIGLRVTKTSRKENCKFRNRSEVHLLNVNELESIHKWFNELIPSNPKHTTKYLIWQKHGFCPPFTTIHQRKEILKNKLDPYSLYERGCRSGQTGGAQDALA